MLDFHFQSCRSQILIFQASHSSPTAVSPASGQCCLDHPKDSLSVSQAPHLENGDNKRLYLWGYCERKRRLAEWWELVVIFSTCPAALLPYLSVWSLPRTHRMETQCHLLFCSRFQLCCCDIVVCRDLLLIVHNVL